MNTQIFKISDPAACRAEVEEAAALLRAGEVVAIPTETVYGLAADAFNPAAVKKIFEAKGRPQDNPLIVHLADAQQLESVAREIPEAARRLYARFSPGPLTVILPKRDTVPDAVSAGLDTVAIRIPSHPVANAIIRAAGVPLAAPSANLSGFPSPTGVTDVLDDMTGRVAAIVDGGDSECGIESTVVSLAVSPPRLLRPGVITAEQLREELPDLVIDDAVLHPMKAGEAAASPGMKYKHYAPKAQISIVRGGQKEFFRYAAAHKNEADTLLVFEEDLPLCPIRAVAMGKENEPLTQTARLFTALRELDKMGAQTVFARSPAPVGVGLGVCNRLYRAAGFRFLNDGPKILGVCGQTGAGKSTVCALLREKGMEIVDTDLLARRIVEPGSPVLQALAEAFGEDILLPNGSLDRKALAAKAFASPEQAKKLSGVTHPAICSLALAQAEEAKRQGRWAVIDAPLLFSAGLDRYCDLTVKVTAPEEERLRRIMARDGIAEEAARSRIAVQAEEDSLSENADHIIENVIPAETERRVEELLLQFGFRNSEF